MKFDLKMPFFFGKVMVIKMKNKAAIKDLKIKKSKNDNSKNTSRNFSGAVEGCVGSVQFQIVPCSSLYFSRSIDPFPCSWFQV